MRLRDYFGGIRFTLTTPLPPDECARRINAAAGSSFSPFKTEVTGGVRLGHLRLRYRSSFMEYNAKPVVAGRVQRELVGSRIDLIYRAPIPIYFFFSFWYGLLALIGITVLTAGEWAPNMTAGDRLLVACMFLAFLIMPLAMHALGTRRSDQELEKLIAFLEDTVEGRRRPG